MTVQSRLSNSVRYGSLGSSAALALGLFFGTSSVVHAQMAFQGVPTVQSGDATIESNAFVDTITVNTNQVVIDWLPDDMAINGADIDFLPAIGTAIYQSEMGGPADFTVLNRIVPVDNTRPIILNGNIISQIDDGLGMFNPGGSVWFYAPGGIVIGGTAVIDVGGLFLTTADPIVDGMGEFIDAGGTTNFAPAISGTFAEIDAGASITLTPENSYVGLLAPIVGNSGDVNVNGSAAYIAAEQASITFNQGLFDINVTIGTDGDIPSGVALNHNGTTGGPVSSGAGDNHRVYAVAVPKNNAISIAIQNGGDIGFDIAGAADVVGNAVILSAGHNVAGDVIANTPVNAIDASIEVENNSFTSAVTARASHNITATAAAGAMAFASNLTLQADDLVDVMAIGPGSAITVDGLTNLSADVQGVVDGEDATGGVVGILGSGGTVTLNGDVTLTANGTGADNFSGMGKLGDGFGGTVEIGAEGGGTVNVSGAVTMTADGIGGFSGSGADGGNGTGGSGGLLANDGNSTVSIDGNLSISAAGNGSSGNGGLNDTNGNAVGGNINITGAGGTNNLIDITGVTTLGTGAIGADAFFGDAGSAIGGNITVDAGSGTTLNFVGTLGVGGAVMGGNSDALGSGGDATGGMALITTSGATGIITTGADVQLSSAAIGGFSSLGISGNTQGGSGIIRSGLGNITITGPATLNADAFGESNSFGGSVALETNSGNLTINNIASLSASGTSGSGADDGTGGNANIIANGGILTIGGTSLALADGFGGFDGGAGSGGTINLRADGGGIVNLAGDVTLVASGIGGDGMGGSAGSGTGGAIFAQAGANSAINVTTQLTLEVNGFGGLADSASDAGNGSGGTVLLGASGGNADFLVGTTTAIAATGGDSTEMNINLNGANAVGGTVTITGSGGTNNLVSLGATTINAVAEHISISDGNGGTAAGGEVNIIAGTGTRIDFNGLSADTSGTAATAAGIGGSASGGAIQLSANGNNANIIVTGGATLIADAVGGDASNGNAGDAMGGALSLSIGSAGMIAIGGNTLLSGAANAGTSSGNGSGGDAFGGSADITAAGGGNGAVTGTNLNIATGATAGSGGDGFNGGNAVGGTTSIQSINSPAGGLSSISFGDTIVDNLASAGNGGNGIAGNAGGNGGNVLPGGTISLSGSAGSGVLTLGNVTINSSVVGGIGGNGGDGGPGTGGNGGDGGSATAASVQLGTTSGIDTPANLGSATFGNTVVTTNAVAGNGGNGGTGATIGDGGNGGEGFAGELTILSRGSPVVIGDVNYTAQTAGGDGGTGTTQGNGGNATGADASILVSNRLNRIEQGSLNTGNISIFSTANAGTGAVAGTGSVGMGQINIVQGTATIASYDAFISGDTAGPGDPPSFISAVNGALNVTNDLTLVTDSNIAVVTDTGAITIGGGLDLDTNGTFVVSSDGVPPANPGLLSVGGATLLASAADVILSTNIQAGAGFATAVVGNVSLGDIASDGVIDIAVTGNAQTGNLTSVGDLLLDTTGTVTAGDVTSGGLIDIVAGGNVQTGNLTSAGDIRLDSGQSILVTGIIMTDGAFVSQAVGSGNYGDISAQGVGNGGVLGISIDTAGGISTGDLSTGSAAIGLLTPSAITTGNVASASDIIILAGTDITAGAVSAANGPDNFIYLANSSMQASFGPGGDPTPLFALDPVATGGSIVINNAVSGGNLVAATAGNFVSQGNIMLSTLFDVEAAGLAGFGGVLAAPVITLISSDIDIGASGGLGDENTTELTLTNSGADGASIGDVASGPLGYDLSNAEAGRLRANVISINSDGAGGVVIGDLNLTGSDGTVSNLVGPDGALQISSANNIRVSGNLNLTDLARDNLLSLTGDIVSVASDTGGILMEGSSLGGTLDIAARHIHVGSTDLLDQLAVDPFFVGRDAILARATPTGNPDGSIQAARITFGAEETLLIQNVGVGGIAYGFYAETGEVEIIPTGSNDLDMVIYGTTLNADDTQVINSDVRDSIFPTAPTSGFTAESSINGCLLTATVCITMNSEDTPIASNVRDTILEQQEAVEEGTDEDVTEEEKEEAEEKATSKSPISRTVSIINTRPMGSTGSISEPVTSGGNPNLMGAPAAPPPSDLGGGDGQ